MDFRVVNCHEAGLELLWYHPDIALWLNSIFKRWLEVWDYGLNVCLKGIACKRQCGNHCCKP